MQRALLARYLLARCGTWLLLWPCLACSATSATCANSPSWGGTGRFRILVKIPPNPKIDRVDEMVAACEVDFDRTLAEHGVKGSVDLASRKVQMYDATTGTPDKSPRFRSTRSPYDRPCRFEDDQMPAEYPSRVGRASETAHGRSEKVIRRREARLFNREMISSRGRLVWSHHQDPGQSSYYAIYFDVFANGQSWGISPAPWIGDADVLRLEHGPPLGGFSHFTATVGDLNGDGLFDIVAGTEKGDLFWFPNRGTLGHPKFLGCKILQDELGPIDTGWYAAPFLYDWDGDGKLDLLVGTSGNVILWWRGVGESKPASFLRSRT